MNDDLLASRINPPPKDMCCQICHRHVDELEAFGGAGDPLVGDFTGEKLVKHWREDFPGQIAPSWDCRDCFGRPGGFREIKEEDRLGRPLSAMERHDLRFEHFVDMWHILLKRQLTDQEMSELRYLLDDWEPEEVDAKDPPEGGVQVTLTDEEIAEAVRQAERRRPAERHEV